MLKLYKYSGTGDTGVFSWLMQRVSAIILLFCILFHFFGMITGMYDGMYRFVLSCVLTFGVFHTVNGFKMITDDYVHCKTGRFVLILLYWFIGIVVLFQGISLIP